MHMSQPSCTPYFTTKPCVSIFVLCSVVYTKQYKQGILLDNPLMHGCRASYTTRAHRGEDRNTLRQYVRRLTNLLTARREEGTTRSQSRRNSHTWEQTRKQAQLFHACKLWILHGYTTYNWTLRTFKYRSNAFATSPTRTFKCTTCRLLTMSVSRWHSRTFLLLACSSQNLPSAREWFTSILRTRTPTSCYI